MTDSGHNRQRALHTLYQDHNHWLCQWLTRKTGCRHTAADLTQDTFVRLMSGRNLADITTPRAYLTTIAKGVLVNYLQRQSLERAYLEALSQLPPDEAPSHEHRLIILESLHEIDAMLDKLPAKAKQAFLLSQFEGLTYGDIAKRLGVSLISVKRYMQQAFRQCLACL